MNHVSGSEIERYIKDIPGIDNVVAVGVRNDKCNQLPAVVVTTKTGFTVTAEEISNIVAKNLPDDYKLRGGVYFLEKIPTGYTGKFKKKEIEQYATEMYNLQDVTEIEQ